MLVPEPPGAAQYTGQLRISRGKQPVCDARPPGSSQYTGAWRILKENNHTLNKQRSQGNTQEHMEVLTLIVGCTVSSPMGSGSC